MKIRTKNKPIHREELSELERAYNILIPEKYKDFLIQYNGGYVAIKDFVLPNGNRVLFNNFLGAKYDDLNIENIHEYLQVDEDVVPKRYFIFGLDPFSNCFCIDKENGQVVGWYHDSIAEQPELICESFSYFMNAILGIKD
jgi:hypothetical protein